MGQRNMKFISDGAIARGGATTFPAQGGTTEAAVERLDAHLLTGRGLSAALLGLPRVAQEVHIVRSVFGGRSLSGHLKEPRYCVLVMGEGQDRGRYYQVRRRTLELLQDGISPDELELEAVSEEDMEQEEA